MSTPPAPDEGTGCRVCGAPAQRGQLVCLECGSRITLAYRRPPSWKVPVAITVAVLLLAGAGGVLAYRALDDEAESEVRAAPANPKEIKATTDETAPEEDSETDSEEAETEKVDGEQADEETAGDRSPAAEGLQKRGDIYAWPSDLRAFTVVLLSAEDRRSATSFARSASGSRDRIGVIDSSRFSSLPTGFFVVFAGRHAGRGQADRAAARLASRFPGAFAQLVRK